MVKFTWVSRYEFFHSMFSCPVSICKIWKAKNKVCAFNYLIRILISNRILSKLQTVHEFQQNILDDHESEKPA
jgi:hypothetical protein